MTKMTKMTGNPFYARGVVNPRYFANRAELLGFFRENIGECMNSKIARPDNIAILGNWGIGKTSTLYKFRDIIHNEMKNARAFSVIFPLKPSICTNADIFATSLMDALFRQYSVSMPLKGRIVETIKEESKVWEKWKLEKLSLKPELKRKDNGGSAVNLTETLLNLWNKLESNGVEIGVIMLDDIHYLLTGGWDGSLYDLRTDIQALSAQGARYMFVITGQTFLYPEMHELAEPFTRLFEKFEIGNLDLDGTREVIEKPLMVEDTGIKISDEVIGRIHDITEGHPFFIVFIMRDLLREIKQGRIDIEKFNEVYPSIIEHLTKTKFQDDFNKATDAERETLLKIAGLNEVVFTPSDIKGGSQSKLFERLMEKELLVKISRGKYRLYHTMFWEFLKMMKKGTS
ncbi:MAG: hypothetical protein KKE96_04875 [Candidatus Altiarchaeota archaeon]|nr:hypothetical protein [Candidatus Altiarchaeota archaeon]